MLWKLPTVGARVLATYYTSSNILGKFSSQLNKQKKPDPCMPCV